MLDANRLPPFRWRKKKGSLIPTSFFQERATKPVATPPPASPQLAETPKSYDKKETPQPPTPPVSPPQKININPAGGKKVSSFSLASIQKKKEWEEKQKTDTVEEQLPEDAFTQEQLNELWQQYQAKKTQQREQNLASLFQLNSPVLLDDFRIEYTVPSPLNKVELEREFVHFLPYLRKSLNNYALQINVLVKESEEKNYIYTPEEKYNRLREINPHIDDLRKELDLDL